MAYCRCLNHQIPGPHDLDCPLWTPPTAPVSERMTEARREEIAARAEGRRARVAFEGTPSLLSAIEDIGALLAECAALRAEADAADTSAKVFERNWRLNLIEGAEDAKGMEGLRGALERSALAYHESQHQPVTGHDFANCSLPICYGARTALASLPSATERGEGAK